MRRVLLCSVFLFILSGLAVPARAATGSHLLHTDDLSPRDHSFCWLWKSSLPDGYIESSYSVLARSDPVTDPSLRIAEPASSLMKAFHTIPSLSLEAMAYQLPLWHFESLSSRASANQEGLCAPDPISDLSFSPQPVIQGQTMVVRLRTRVQVACEITYLGHTVPCYRDDDNVYYALLGVPALASPGVYPLYVSLSAGGRQSTFDIDVELVKGSYGYQFIDPPVTLSGLLDAELMQNEWAYLKTWRDLRTKARMWTYPLRAPLDPMPSISADYGDRRSYGGMFEGYHSGVDYRASTGTPVLSPTAGRVVLTEQLAARGNMVLVDHGWGVVTGYWHLSAIDVHNGDMVLGGQTLGWVGNTGLSTGSHLHWEVWVNGVAVDGQQWLDAGGLPLNLSYPSLFGSGDGLSEPIVPDPY